MKGRKVQGIGLLVGWDTNTCLLRESASTDFEAAKKIRLFGERLGERDVPPFNSAVEFYWAVQRAKKVATRGLRRNCTNSYGCASVASLTDYVRELDSPSLFNAQ